MNVGMTMSAPKSSRKIGLLIGLAAVSTCLLQGCFGSESEPPPYPPLSQKELVGCWKWENPDDCRVSCFDSTGGYLYLSRSDESRVIVAEDSGSYRISENEILLSSVLKNTEGLVYSSGSTLSRAIVDGKQVGVSGNNYTGTVLVRVHPDSFPCGLKPWTLFQKPATWTLF